VADLRDALTVSIRAGVRHLILDCADLTFLDASGVGVLVVASNDLTARNGKLVLRNPSTAVRIVLEAAGLSELLEGHGPEPTSTHAHGFEATVPGSLSR
jgi:anti-anti-sigma factor